MKNDLDLKSNFEQENKYIITHTNTEELSD